jgi:hypothetical protein
VRCASKRFSALHSQAYFPFCNAYADFVAIETGACSIAEMLEAVYAVMLMGAWVGAMLWCVPFCVEGAEACCPDLSGERVVTLEATAGVTTNSQAGPQYEIVEARKVDDNELSVEPGSTTVPVASLVEVRNRKHRWISCRSRGI